ncbi:glutaredoxin domain-containing cysteine-rich protein 2 [Astyanax mexicanus]|uniref:Glutaredoxin domain-containing cysteine-rich protein 2 n=2 Tax=Astyanax mexicanus TaxID=7994 RepID=A0A8T2L564_ASTMX|nr:glutaredoxin domain-containing cysteine-rich protein 2 [Astyanax mexicanus]
MEEPQKKSGQRYESKPRKVRFKLASSYSGRVLKHVYEDGQELDSPEEKYPHSFIHTKIPQHLDMGQLYGFQEMQDEGLYPPTGLIAQRINVYRGGSGYRPPDYGDQPDGEEKAPVLDFGKIIIYTSNLKIIRSPHRKGESSRSHHRSRREGGEASPGRESRSKGKQKSRSSRSEERSPAPKQKASVKKEVKKVQEVPEVQEVQEVASCGQCGGSGSAPCSLCHGSKLSMLANRFNESIRELRCPACNPDGLEQCQLCAQ